MAVTIAMTRSPRWTHLRAGVAIVAGLFGLVAPARPARAQFLATSLCDATPGNLVQNCGFETGDPSGWTLSVPLGNSAEIAELPTSAHSGRYVAQLSGFQASTVMESLATTPGTPYTFTFYLVSLSPGGDPASSAFFQAFFGGQQVLDLVGQGPNFDVGYARYSFTQTATAASTDIRFVMRNASAIYDLDDVSVSATTAPEPTTAALAAAGLAGALALGAARRRARS